MIKIMLLSAAASIVIVYILQIHKLKFRGKLPLNFKPLNCENCLAGWLSLFLLLFTGTGIVWIYYPFIMSGAMILTILLTKLLNKL